MSILRRYRRWRTRRHMRSFGLGHLLYENEYGALRIAPEGQQISELVERNEDGTIGPEHVTDQGIELK